ncbi:MAG: PIN domain-containing protein [Acidobacteria bacterium]|nr:PIN domain-containing protein [Acidobacteriota bacterium]
MKIIVDTSVWSLALRRNNPQSIVVVQEFKQIIHNHQVQMIGPIRQEILSGIRNESQFGKLQKYLASFPDLPIATEDYITAAKYYNKCRSKGLQGSNTDFLICAISNRYEFPIFTTDGDFRLFSKHIPIVIHKAIDRA